MIGLVVGIGVALLPGPASAGGASNPSDRATGVRAASATTLTRTDGGLTVESLAVPAASAQARSAGTAAELVPTRVPAFRLVGVTWRAGTLSPGTTVELRLRSVDGGVDGGEDVWTDWQLLPYEESEGPSADEEPGARGGTGPLWTGAADGLAVRVKSPRGPAPADLTVVTVDPGDEPAAAAASTARAVAVAKPSSGRPITRAPSFPALPRVITRRQWGADPSLTESCDAPRYGRTAKMVFVHHTVNANDYSPRESPAIVRAIYAYHTQGQHWCDIGYNALVDRFGNIYEGRRGGFRKPVRGAHAGDYNTGSVGVSLIGNYETARPTARSKNALVRFIGWRLGTSYQPVRGTVRVEGTRFDRIAGHRDAMSTACPGRYVYQLLPTIRRRVADYLSRYDSRLAHKADRLGEQRTGPVWKGERHVHGGFRTVFGKGKMYGTDRLGAHFLRGRVLHGYQSIGGPTGRLGWPKADVRQLSIAGARVLVTQTGRVYQQRHHRVAVVYGPIYRRYRSMGLAHSRLGLPVTSVVHTGFGQRITFQHGVANWDRSSDRTTVTYQ